MYVMMISSELAPVAKVGGLADVVFGLSRELEIRGNSVEIILPKYDRLWYDQIWGLCESYHNLIVPWGEGTIPCTVWFGFVHGRKVFFIEPHSEERFFERGTFYGEWDDATRFAFFCKAAMEFLLRSGKRPDVIHCHDWQTGLVPVLLYEMYQHPDMPHQRVCYTIHNFRHQGMTNDYVLWATGLGRVDYFTHQERLQDNFNEGALNMMKGGIVYSNFVSTVSPHHAWEVRFTDQSFGFGHTLHIHQEKFGGILNGIDYDVWNPEVDPLIAAHFDAETLEAKAGNAAALRQRLLLEESDKPIVAYVGRLDQQKGVHLVRHALFHALAHGAQFVLLGSSPEPDISDQFHQLRAFLADNPDCHLELGFSEQLAHLIYAGSDMVIVPSMYEPCGLTQMIGMRYGTIPIVRSVGGLADTVFDWDYSDRPADERNGFVFEHADLAAIEFALNRAIGLYRQSPNIWKALQRQAMAYDYSWNKPGEHYLRIYEMIRHK